MRARVAPRIYVRSSAVAGALGLGTGTISRTEDDMLMTPEIVGRYRDWLATVGHT